MRVFTGVLVIIGFILLNPFTALAAKPDLWGACDGTAATNGVICDSKTDNVDSFVTPVVNTLLAVVGVLAVVMIIVGGLKYITSGGDAAKLTSAKNTILYSVIGLVVAIFAYAIVSWINTNAPKNFDPATSSGSSSQSSGSSTP